MADHAKPRVLRVFVGDRTTAPRPGADTDDGIRAAVTVSDAIDTFLAAVDDRSARDRRGGAPPPPPARAPRRGPARRPRRGPAGAALRPPDGARPALVPGRSRARGPWGEARRCGPPRPCRGAPRGAGRRRCL